MPLAAQVHWANFKGRICLKDSLTERSLRVIFTKIYGLNTISISYICSDMWTKGRGLQEWY